MAAPVSIDLDKLLDSDDDADEVCATTQVEIVMNVASRGRGWIVYDGANARSAGANSACCRPQQLCQFICRTPQPDCSAERSSGQPFTCRQVVLFLTWQTRRSNRWCVSSCRKLVLVCTGAAQPLQSPAPAPAQAQQQQWAQPVQQPAQLQQQHQAQQQQVGACTPSEASCCQFVVDLLRGRFMPWYWLTAS